ncbi:MULTISPECIES: molybdate ABC transporter substrate-binding protein [unclassified Luteococcus]|uniref:molybdate ABC transporter substrate-binding protein n=1 Tax=unclassified Luteococcus TaxID=2639923 RepID=UPI00313A7C8D
MLTRRRVLATLAVLPLAACGKDAGTPASTAPDASGGASSSGDVVVYAPGALAAQTKKLAEAFAAAGLGKATFEVGHTPIQREQLAKGATPDVWIAANPDDMKTTAQKGLVAKDSVTQLGRTKLVVVVAPDNPGKVAAVEDLAKPGTTVLLGAETLPIWKVTAKSFAKIEAGQPGFTAKVMANVVSREMGVQPIVTKVQQGVADAGVVFITDLPAEKKGLTTVDIPDPLNAMLPLSAATVTAGKNAVGGKAFLDFLASGAGKKVLDDAGFLPPAP